MSAPMMDAATTVKRIAFQPRNAPMHAMNFTSPKPIASRRNEIFRTVPLNSFTFSSSCCVPSSSSRSYCERSSKFSRTLPSNSRRAQSITIQSFSVEKSSSHHMSSPPMVIFARSPSSLHVKARGSAHCSVFFPNAILPSTLTSHSSPKPAAAPSSDITRPQRWLVWSWRNGSPARKPSPKPAAPILSCSTGIAALKSTPATAPPSVISSGMM